MLIIVLPLILAACGSESTDVPEDRQFANDPVTEVAPTETAVVDEDATPIVVATAATVSPETLLRSRGAPDTLYTLLDGHLMALAIQDGESTAIEIELPQGQRVLDFDGSPNGDRVAMLAQAEDGKVFLHFFHSLGVPIGNAQEVLASAGSATPVAADGDSDALVRWSPQGTGVLVMNAHSLETVAVAGEPNSIPLDDFDGRLIGAERSPQGSRIFLYFVEEDGSQHVYVRDLETGKTRDVRALGTEPGIGLTNLHWLPDGSGMSYVKGPLVDNVVAHGQMSVYILGQEAPRLIATSGQGGPSATITSSVVSPDGRSVAFVISVQDRDRWTFHSMWVRALDGSQSYQVPVVPRGVVTNLAWVDRGIAWEQSPRLDEAGEIVLIRQDQGPEVVFDPSSIVPTATPGASPVASPGATAVGTPEASPVATPIP